jgi:hypothetical protein
MLIEHSKAVGQHGRVCIWEIKKFIKFISWFKNRIRRTGAD